MASSNIKERKTCIEMNGPLFPNNEAHTKMVSEDEILNLESEQKIMPLNKAENKPSIELIYSINDKPPWYLCIILALQHYILAFGGIIAVPLILAEPLCVKHDNAVKSQLISTIFFVSGICTILQTTIGTRLPILQGGTFSLITPTLAILSLPQWKCQDSEIAPFNGTEKNFTADPELWQRRIREVLLGMCLSWLICYILTYFDAISKSPTSYGYAARTDINSDAILNSPWFHVPYPGQWGCPTVSLSSVLGMLSGVLSSTIESVGDYYTCARLSGAPLPPTHALNRGIGMEGIGCILAGIWGTGNGTTSYSQNIAALGITKVGSRIVLQTAGILLIILGLFGKFGAIFITIPEPVIGGMFMIMFGMIAAVGISNLQFVDLNSSRNLFVLGFSLFSGLVIPTWLADNPGVIDTGIKEVDQTLTVLLTTHMFVGGFFGCFLDNTIPGSDEERGTSAWYKQMHGDKTNGNKGQSCYDLPFITKYLRKLSWSRYIPFLPTFQMKKN
ncbi:solute carrier family 23 member 1 isoform X3 [Pelobates cultripes]|uniref:Solute carrier family 23 member 1 isoform X3 n=1 Tax=Pelobates cultripes TaxID=61616 RepID=A0AAD1W2A9_PELCU|nr:solute carrier family 23 member 1 isoform X3 [Pelobates cultripes]